MQDDQSKSTRHMDSFSFVATIGTTEILFAEVTGLNVDTEAIEKPERNRRLSSPIGISVPKKHARVTLKRGIARDGKSLSSMHNDIERNSTKRQTITISLLNEAKEVSKSWTLHNAFPVKVVASDLNATGNDVAIESIELEHEGLKVS